MPRLTMQLDWHLNAQFAGLCVAESLGYYRRAGLVVNLKAAEPAMDVVQTVVTQPQTLGCAEESLILTAQSEGIDIVAIAAMLQASPLALMSLPQHSLTHPRQLIGKRIGVHSDGRKALELVLYSHNIDPQQVDLVDIPYDKKYQRLSQGEFDAVQCYALDEPIEFAQRAGQVPTVLPLKDYGFDAYSQVIFAPTSLVMDQPQNIQHFLSATFAGWRWAIEHPSTTANLLVEQYVEPDYQNIAYQQASLEILADYVLPKDAPRLGIIDARRWHKSAKQLQQAGLIAALPPMAMSVNDNLWP